MLPHWLRESPNEAICILLEGVRRESPRDLESIQTEQSKEASQDRALNSPVNQGLPAMWVLSYIVGGPAKAERTLC